jgi:Ca2+-binding RTX toxin-like protein
VYTNASGGVLVNLSANDVTSTGATWATGSTGTKYLKQTATSLGTGDTGTDTLISIEGVVGSSFSDTLIGSAGNDTLNGMGGADFIVFTCLYYFYSSSLEFSLISIVAVIYLLSSSSASEIV